MNHHKQSLKKDVITKQDIHQCKQCHGQLPTFMSLLKHVAEHHFEDPSEGQENISEDEAILNLEAFIKQGDHGNVIEDKKSPALFLKKQCWLNSCKEEICLNEINTGG